MQKGVALTRSRSRAAASTRRCLGALSSAMCRKRSSAGSLRVRDVGFVVVVAVAVCRSQSDDALDDDDDDDGDEGLAARSWRSGRVLLVEERRKGAGLGAGCCVWAGAGALRAREGLGSASSLGSLGRRRAKGAEEVVRGPVGERAEGMSGGFCDERRTMSELPRVISVTGGPRELS